MEDGRVARGVAATLARLVALALVCVQLVTCAGPGAGIGAVEAVEVAEVTLGWASTTFDVLEPEGAVVMLDVVVRNRTESVTRSTSIEWEPAFAAELEVLESDPPAWRVRVDERGWGVLDTSGIPAYEDGWFRVWFGAREGATLGETTEAPRIRVIVDGGHPAGEGVATPAHAGERARALTQQMFERGRIAAVVDRLGPMPAGGQGAFGVAVGVSASMLGIVTVGMVAAYGVTKRS